MEQFSSTKPNDPRLLPYISYYYFHELSEPEDEVNFTFFPHFKHGFTVYFDTDGKVIKAHFSQNYEHHIPVQLNGCTRKMGVAFHPLGMNHFVQQSMKSLVDMEGFHFPHWNKEVESDLGKLFNLKHEKERTDLLDHFFMAKLVKRTDLNLLYEMLELVFESFGTITVNDLALRFNVSRKTVQRHFKEHLLCAPETYKKVVKFRSALSAAQQQEQKNLTELSLYSLYYDQADFNKRFKELTGQTPKHFFQSIQQMGEEDIFWKRECPNRTILNQH